MSLDEYMRPASSRRISVAVGFDDQPVQSRRVAPLRSPRFEPRWDPGHQNESTNFETPESGQVG